jgi:hypothetical protein
MASINSTPRPAYVYDESTSSWYQIAGKADTSSSYEWSGTHAFSNNITADQVITAKKGFNVFLNPAARDTAIPTATHGLIVFLKNDANGNAINDLQVYDGSSWTSINDPLFIFNQQSSSYTLQLIDSYKMIEMSAGGTLTIPADSSINFPVGTAIDIVQTGASQVTIAGAGGVTVNATPGLKLRTQWSSATIVKRSANTWLVMGDLVA